MQLAHIKSITTIVTIVGKLRSWRSGGGVISSLSRRTGWYTEGIQESLMLEMTNVSDLKYM